MSTGQSSMQVSISMGSLVLKAFLNHLPRPLMWMLQVLLTKLRMPTVRALSQTNELVHVQASISAVRPIILKKRGDQRWFSWSARPSDASVRMLFLRRRTVLTLYFPGTESASAPASNVSGTSTVLGMNTMLSNHESMAMSSSYAGRNTVSRPARMMRAYRRQFLFEGRASSFLQPLSLPSTRNDSVMYSQQSCRVSAPVMPLLYSRAQQIRRITGRSPGLTTTSFNSQAAGMSRTVSAGAATSSGSQPIHLTDRGKSASRAAAIVPSSAVRPRIMPERLNTVAPPTAPASAASTTTMARAQKATKESRRKTICFIRLILSRKLTI